MYLHQMSPNTACNCLLHMNLSIVQLLCLQMHVYLFVSISCSDFLSVFSFVIYIYIYTSVSIFIYLHMYTFVFNICLYNPIYVHYFLYLSGTFLAHVLRPNSFFTAVPISLHTAAVSLHCRKKAPETCACFLLPCMYPSSAHLFPHSCGL